MKFKFCKSLLISTLLTSMAQAAPSNGVVETLSDSDTLSRNDLTVLLSPNYQTGIDAYGNTTVAFASNDLVNPRDSRRITPIANVSGINIQATTLRPAPVFLSDGTVDTLGSYANSTVDNTDTTVKNSNEIINVPYPFTPSLTALNVNNTFKLAVSLSGNAILVWTRVVNSRSVLMAAYMPLISAPSTFGPWTVTQLSDPNATVTDFSAAIDESGNALVAWRLSNGLARNSNGLLISTSVVQAAYTDTSLGATKGTWLMATQPGTPAQAPPLSPSIQDYTLSSQDFNVSQTPAVGIAQGNATVAWQISTGNVFTPSNDGRSRLVVQAAYRAKNLQWEVFDKDGNGDIDPTNQTTVLSPLAYNVSSPPKVTAYANTSVVTWQVVGAYPLIPNNAIQAFVRHF